MHNTALRTRWLRFYILTLLIFLTAGSPAHSAQVETLPLPQFVEDSDDGFQFNSQSFNLSLEAFLAKVPLRFGVILEREPVLKIRIFSKGSKSEKPLRLIIAGGVHGDEPLGSQTVLDVAHNVLINKSLSGNLEIVLLPVLNRGGLLANSRYLDTGDDLNREFAKEPPLELVREIKNAIGTKPFDLALDLHGARRRQHFFVIKSGDDGHLASKALATLNSSFLLKADNGESSGYVGALTSGTFDPHRYWLESPGLATSTNQGTLKSYLASQGTPYSYTIEYPGNVSVSFAREKNLELVMSLIRAASRK